MSERDERFLCARFKKRRPDLCSPDLCVVICECGKTFARCDNHGGPEGVRGQGRAMEGRRDTMGSEKPTKVELGMRFSCEALGECVTEKQRPDGQWQLRWLKYNCLTDFAWSDVQLLNKRTWDYLGPSSAPAAIPRVRRPKQAPPMTEAAIFAAMVERDKVRTAPQLFPAVVERGPRQSVNLSCGGVWSLRTSRLDNRGARGRSPTADKGAP